MSKWETTEPTECGLYWAMLEGDTEPYMVEITRDRYANLKVWLMGDPAHVNLAMFTHWQGPLPHPEPPQP